MAKTQSSEQFKGSVNLWLMSVGLSQENIDTVLADRRVELSVKLKDPVGFMQDVTGPLVRLGDAGKEGYTLLQNPMEKLMLISLLRG